MWPEERHNMMRAFMCIGKLVDSPVEANSLLHSRGIIKLFLTLYKIADHISHQ